MASATSGSGVHAGRRAHRTLDAGAVPAGTPTRTRPGRWCVSWSVAWLPRLPGSLGGGRLVLAGLAGWIAFLAVVAGIAYVLHVVGVPPEIAYPAAFAVIAAVLVHRLLRLRVRVKELRATRAEVARSAIADERLRISRDLHDLLGYSISAIALKTELTARLVRTNPDRAGQEISEVLDISRRTLADVRSVASGYREMSLVEEALSARPMLRAAEVAACVDVSGADGLPEDVSTVLAIVLREGVTNVLRHSAATTCDIAILRSGNRVQLEIVNDGVREKPRERPGGGSGVESLSARVAAVHGRLTSEGLPGRRWRLRATVPLDLAG